MPPRPLEEVLRDPSANWHEIRSAIKGQRGASACTNVAIMQALVNEKSWATAAVATAIVMKEEQQQQKQKQQADQNYEENNENKEASDGRILDNSGDLESGNSGGTNEEADNIIEVLTARLPTSNNSTDTLSTENETNNTRSFRRRRGRRRGSGVGTSFRGSGRRRGTRRNSGKASFASINMMDFGVTDTALNLSDSNESGSDNSNLKGSGDFSDEVSKSGFMGWKHYDDISVRSSYTHDKSSELDGSDKVSIVLSDGDADDLKEDFSSLVDSSGFLDWHHSIRRRSSFNSAKRRPSSRSSFGDDEDEVEGFLDWHHSIRKRSSFIGTVDEAEDELYGSIDEWNIADYDGPENSAHSSNYKPMSALTDRLDRLKMFGSTRKVEVDPEDDISISDIKEALLNVRKEVENDNMEQEQPTSRRPTICGVPNPANLLNLEATTKKTRTRRQTVIGSVAMLGAMLNGAKSDTKNNGEIQEEDNYLDCSSGSTVPRKKALDRRRKTIMDGIAPFVGMSKDQVEKAADTPIHDDRAAIRISREDGNVDIERECRKLYSNGLYGDLDCFSSEHSK